MDCLDLTKVLCRICITGDDNLSNMFTKKVKQSEAAATKLIEESAVLDMTLSDALEACTCIEVNPKTLFFPIASETFFSVIICSSNGMTVFPKRFAKIANTN